MEDGRVSALVMLFNLRGWTALAQFYRSVGQAEALSSNFQA